MVQFYLNDIESDLQHDDMIKCKTMQDLNLQPIFRNNYCFAHQKTYLPMVLNLLIKIPANYTPECEKVVVEISIVNIE